MRRYNHGGYSNYLNRRIGFSGAVLVSKGGNIEFQQAYGWSDRKNGQKNELNTKFNVGSMLSKPITALCIMQLIEKGSVTLGQPIGKYFPHYRGTGITVHHLLNHTSGIVNYLMLRKKIKWDQNYTPDEILHVVEKEKLKFTAGKKSSYNNTAYLMLGLIIEYVSGVSYYEYVRENVLKPAGMVHTGFISDQMDRVALNYIKHVKGPDVSPTVLFACGEIVSTIEDVYQFERKLKEDVLIKKETRLLMERPSYEGKFVTIGYGWFIKNLFGRRSVCHGGTHPGGYTSHIERYLDEDISIIVLSNDMTPHDKMSMKEFGGTLISREIASILFNQKLSFWQKII